MGAGVVPHRASHPGSGDRRLSKRLKSEPPGADEEEGCGGPGVVCRGQEAEDQAQPDPEEGDAPVDEPQNQIVVMSDGETTTGRPDVQAAQAAAEAGVPVNTIAFGTQGATIDIPGNGPVDVSVNEQALEAIAETTLRNIRDVELGGTSPNAV